jgi:hypothetical protein
MSTGLFAEFQAALQAGALVVGESSFTFGSDANGTLPALTGIVKVTGSVISVTRSLFASLTAGAVVILSNQEGHSVTFIGATGTGVTVATTKSAILRCDGTNWIRVTADA